MSYTVIDSATPVNQFIDQFNATAAKADGDLSSGGGSLSGAINEAKGADIASAATTNIGAATGNFINITGTTTITAFGTVQAGTRRIITFSGILILTHNSTSLKLPGNANITTAVGDRAQFTSLGSGNWQCDWYTRADGTPLVVSIPIASTNDAQTGTDNTKAITSLRLRDAINASGSAPIYACRAWVNFCGAPLTGTYSQSGTTVTVNITGHGMTTGMVANVNPTTGTGVAGSYTVTVVNANSYTYTAGTSLTTSGNITQNIFIRSSGNISSIVDNGVGDYTINFITALSDTSYSASGCLGTGAINDAAVYALKLVSPDTYKTISSVRVGTTYISTASVNRGDFSDCSVQIFR